MLPIYCWWCIYHQDCNSRYIWCYCHTIANPSLDSRMKAQAGTEHFVILRDIVIHNRHIKGELIYTIIKWAQTKFGEGTIVTRSYIWMKGVCVHAFVCVGVLHCVRVCVCIHMCM